MILLYAAVVSIGWKKGSGLLRQSEEKLLPDYPAITFDFNSTPLFHTRQKMVRKHVLPKSFELVHLWISLVKNYQMQ